MIKISELTEKDKGREVEFYLSAPKYEYGIISSWNDRYIFVKYNGNPQSQATSPEHLRVCIATDTQDVLP
jgi:hypothetical protein